MYGIFDEASNKLEQDGYDAFKMLGFDGVITWRDSLAGVCVIGDSNNCSSNYSKNTEGRALYETCGISKKIFKYTPNKGEHRAHQYCLLNAVQTNLFSFNERKDISLLDYCGCVGVHADKKNPSLSYRKCKNPKLYN